MQQPYSNSILDVQEQFGEMESKESRAKQGQQYAASKSSRHKKHEQTAATAPSAINYNSFPEVWAHEHSVVSDQKQIKIRAALSTPKASTLLIILRFQVLKTY